jgi:hypothetical protein
VSALTLKNLSALRVLCRRSAILSQIRRLVGRIGRTVKNLHSSLCVNLSKTRLGECNSWEQSFPLTPSKFPHFPTFSQNHIYFTTFSLYFTIFTLYFTIFTLYFTIFTLYFTIFSLYFTTFSLYFTKFYIYFIIFYVYFVTLNIYNLIWRLNYVKTKHQHSG